MVLWQPEKSADDISSLWARSEQNAVLRLGLSVSLIYELPQCSLSNKQLSSYTNTCNRSKHLSSNTEKVKSEQAP